MTTIPHFTNTRQISEAIADLDEMLDHQARLIDALVASITDQNAQLDNLDTRLEGLEAITDYIHKAEDADAIAKAMAVK